MQHFVETCPMCQQAPQKTVKKHQGAKTLMSSLHFRDRIQVDLIDCRSDPQLDANGVAMKWILVVKDHHTKLTCLRALKSKEAEQVARELDHLFGFIGFPLTFHTDNGGEFTAKKIVDMLKHWNQECNIVTGRPRTPRDQGSVENINKFVKRILSNIGEQDRANGIKPNWANNLGRTMAAINSYQPAGKDSTNPHFHVFCMKFNDPFTLPNDMVNQCNTIDDVLKLCNDNSELKKKFVNLGFLVDKVTNSSSKTINELPPIKIEPESSSLYPKDDELCKVIEERKCRGILTGIDHAMPKKP